MTIYFQIAFVSTRHLIAFRGCVQNIFWKVKLTISKLSHDEISATDWRGKQENFSLHHNIPSYRYLPVK